MRQLVQHTLAAITRHAHGAVETVVLSWRWSGPWRAVRGRMAASAATM